MSNKFSENSNERGNGYGRSRKRAPEDKLRGKEIEVRNKEKGKGAANKERHNSKSKYGEIPEQFRKTKQHKPKWGKFIMLLGVFVIIYEIAMISSMYVNPEFKNSIIDKIFGTESRKEQKSELLRADSGDSQDNLKEDSTEQASDASEKVKEEGKINSGKETETGLEADSSSVKNDQAFKENDITETETAVGTGHAENDEPVEIVFAGDIYLSDHVMEAYEAAGDDIGGVLSEGYRKEIEEADFFVANEEFPFSNRGEQAKDKQYTFRVDPKYVSMFKELDIDLVTLANNHTLDFGTEALLDTVSTLDEAGIKHVGAGKNLSDASEPVIVDIKGKKIAFIGATRVMPEPDWAAGESTPGLLAAYSDAALIKAIKAVRDKADIVIVYMHWGQERHEYPNEVQQTLSHVIVDAGADLVIGAHPHVLQGFEYYQDVPIAYSLGNFIFGSSIPKTALLKATIAGDNNITLQLIPGTSGAGYTRKIDDDSKKTDFYSYIADISSGIKIDDQGNISEK